MDVGQLCYRGKETSTSESLIYSLCDNCIVSTCFRTFPQLIGLFQHRATRSNGSFVLLKALVFKYILAGLNSQQVGEGVVGGGWGGEKEPTLCCLPDVDKGTMTSWLDDWMRRLKAAALSDKTWRGMVCHSWDTHIAATVGTHTHSRHRWDTHIAATGGTHT